MEAVPISRSCAHCGNHNPSQTTLGNFYIATCKEITTGGAGNYRTCCVAPEGTPSDVKATGQAFVRNAVAQYEAQHASLSQQRAENQAALAAANAEIMKLEEALPFIDQQMSARAELAEKGFFSRLKLLEYEQLRAEHLRNIDVQQANRMRAEASIGRLDAELRSLRAGFGRTAVTDLAEANDRATMASEELRKAERRRQYQELRAPVDGVVQQLAVSTVGGRGARPGDVVSSPTTRPVRPLDRGTYGELLDRKKNLGESEALDMDHTPSFASQRLRAERELGRPLSPQEANQLRLDSPAVASPRGVHQQTSPTYGGRNTPARQLEDSLDPAGATARDTQVLESEVTRRAIMNNPLR